MMICTFIILILLLCTFFTTVAGEENLTGLSLLFLVFSIFYILLLVYLAKVLSIFNEQPAIIGAFTVMACLGVINLAKDLFRLDGTYSTSIGILSEVFSIYMAIQAFKVKSKTILLRFRLFGGVVLLLSFANVALVLIHSFTTGKQWMYYWQLTVALILCTGYFILNAVSTYLKTTQIIKVSPD